MPRRYADCRGCCRAQRDPVPLRDHSRRFDEVAARRGQGNAEVIPFAAPLQGARAGADRPRGRGPAADLRRARQPRDRPPPLPLGRDGEEPRAAPTGEAASALARTCSRRRLPPRTYRVEPALASFRFSTACGYPSTGGCPVAVENASYVRAYQDDDAPGLAAREARRSMIFASDSLLLSWGLTANQKLYPFRGRIQQLD